MSKKYDIIFAPFAEDDLEEIYSFISQNDIEKADEVYNEILEAIETQFYEYPEICKIVGWEPGFSLGIRQKDVGNYSVLYIVDKEKYNVYVIGVLYGTSNLAYKMSKRFMTLI